MENNSNLDLSKVVTGLLSKAYKIDSGKIAEILNGENATTDSVLKEILTEDAARIERLKGDNFEGTYQQAYAKAKKEVLTARETELKEKYGIDSEKTGLDLIDAIITEKSAQAAKGATPDENTVKTSPAYIALEKQLKKQVSDTEKTWSEKYNALEAQRNADKVFAGVKAKAETLLKGLNPVESKNPNVAANIKNQFFAALEQGYKFETAQDGTVIIKDAEGNVKSDAHGHNLTLDALVKDVSSNYYDFAENNGGANAGNENGDGKQGAYQGATPQFKTEAEVMKYATDESVPLEARNKALETWNAAQNGQ